MEITRENIYTLNQVIRSKKEMNYKSLFEIFEEIKNLLEIDYFLFLEKSPVIPGYITYRYDSREKWVLQSESYSDANRWSFANIFEEIDIRTWGMMQRISYGKETQWYFIIGKKNYDKEFMSLLAWMLAIPVNLTISNRYKKK